MGCYAALRRTFSAGVDGVFRNVTSSFSCQRSRGLRADDIRLAIGEKGRIGRLWRPAKELRGAVTVQTGGSEPWPALGSVRRLRNGLQLSGVEMMRKCTGATDGQILHLQSECTDKKSLTQTFTQSMDRYA